MKKEKDNVPISTENSLKNKTGSWRSLKPIINRKKCISCRICQQCCPDSCVILNPKAEVNYDYCKGCGVCAQECPVKCIEMVEEEK